jgi:signal recognition particle receptor subunit beta
MVSINYSSREVCCKIVYYGPGLSGKTSNLQYVHSKVPANTRGNMISLATEADRTLYFDFLPINIGTINGFAAKFQLYTVPGQVYYNATRKLVLRGVDGVVFVADSQPDKMDENIDSLINLEENLREYGYDLNDLPVVFQYNKRDLPGVLPVAQLNAQLNKLNVPCFEASATQGMGVFDTLKKIIKLVLDKAKQGSGPSRPQPVAAAAGASMGVPSRAPEAPAPVMPARERPDTEAVTPEIAAEPPSVPTPEPVAAAVAASSPGHYRPYPGSQSQGVDISDRRIRASAFAPVQKEPHNDAAMERGLVSGGDAGTKGADELKAAPVMAPSLRRKAEHKKRGFFKRLFGIK